MPAFICSYPYLESSQSVCMRSDGHFGVQTDGQTDGHTRRTHRRTDRQTDIQTDRSTGSVVTWMTKVLLAMLPAWLCFSSSRVAKTVPLPVAASRPSDPCNCTGCTNPQSGVDKATRALSADSNRKVLWPTDAVWGTYRLQVPP